MTLELRILSGTRAGVRERFGKSVVSVGRHPLSDLRFDPLRDLDVSTRHAELRGIDGVWSIHDQRSTNGTFVNGQRVEGERVLRPGDVITFGANGPRVEVQLPVAAAPVVDDVAIAAPVSLPARQDTTPPVAEAVASHARSMRRTVGIGLGLLAVALGVGLFALQR